MGSGARGRGLMLAAMMAVVACSGESQAVQAAEGVAPPERVVEVAGGEREEMSVEVVSDSVPILSGSAFRLGGSVVMGRYSCRDIPGEQLSSIGQGSVAPGRIQTGTEFELRSAQEYAYFYGGAKPGSYRYEPQSARLTFTSGPFSSEPGEEATIHGYYGSRRDSNLAVVVLIFRDPAYGETYEYCVRVER